MTTTLEELKDWWLSQPTSSFKPVEVRNSGNRMSIIAYRNPPYQIELVMWGPGCVVPAHYHPNIDAIALAVSGELVLLLGDSEDRVNDLVGRARTWKASTLKDPIRIGPSVWHGGKASEKGASFWSFQRWTDGAKISAAGVDWVGPPLVEPKMMGVSSDD